ncbi:TPA: SslE/AcfD family lipoprotein zinc metalloprotease [Escherichia coli]|nr:SslE/AcfD family lipoprotein zinc metalloprotease [Escherichia coli]
MNKKFKYKKSLLAAILSATLLAGCDGGGSGSSSDTPPVDSGTGSLPEVKPDPTPNPEPTPEPTPDPEPTPEPIPDPEPTPEPEPEPVPTKTGYLTLGGSQRVTGATCNGESSDGFTFKPGEDVTCVAGNTTIATFNTQSEAARSLRAVEKVSFSLEDAQELAGSDDKKSNAVSLVTSSNSCPANTEQVCLTFSSVIESKRFDSLYKQIDLAPEEFKKLVNEEVENNAATDKAPSTHTSPVVPVTTPGTKPDLNASFVSANAEQFYQYQPTEIILSEGRLVDSQGDGVVGVNYYTNSGRGVTGENGEFSFSWGETISFGIDTFELGSVRGNKSTIALTELGDEVRGANIDQLIHRYSKAGQNHTRVVPDEVRKVFAEYPNVINEIINLSLSNGATLGEGEQVVNLPNEFIEQFKTGQAKEIDTAICAKTDGCNEARWFSLTTRNVNDGQIQGVINKLWGVDTNYKSVSKFHVFHDSTNFYGSTGNARGQAVVNISNAAFPILMARNDKNYWLAFGEKRTWDKNELAYITEAPSLVEPENVTRDTATFNLPFISLGQVGEGKLMVIGNPHYNSILRCPNGYSWNGGVNKDGQCTLNSDPDDMKNFMENVLRYLSDDKWKPDAKASMTVGTNLDTVYFKRHGQVTGNSTAFDFHPDFAGISVEHLSSYGDLDPQEMPLLILNGFEYVTQVGNDPYAIPLRADTSKPKLTQQDVTDLIAYLNKGGSVLIMENVMSNLKEESASGFVRLLDAAGLSMALNKSVVNNDPQGYPNRVRQQRATGIWVYERYPAVDGALPYTIDSKTGEVKWKYQVENKPDDKPKLEVASWLEDVDGKQETRYAFIDEADHKTEDSLKAAKEKIFAAFPGLKECTNPAYHYEVNCLEYRPGTGVPVTGGMYVPQYTQLSLNADTAKAMVQAADLGTNIQRLYQHELYFRTNGRKGERLSSVDLERLYQNMSVWLWNDTSYRYEEGKNDDAHSGYPVMNSSFSPNSTTLPTTPLNDWLIWHEVGHNAAETPLTVPGATEVANNVLALYMQDRYLGKMNRVADDITVAPEYLEESNNQAWARGGAGDRLLMYAQLKEWAEKNFDIKKWYPDGTPLPEFYSEREGMKGWNLFQLMHRKARGDEVSNDKFGGKNYCAESNGNAADTLMLCASWVAQTDLSEFFKKWNPGANAYQLPGASEMSFEGGVSQSAYNTLASLDLPKPEQGPETINQVTEHKMSAE